jgi:hypothetical protein
VCGNTHTHTHIHIYIHTYTHIYTCIRTYTHEVIQSASTVRKEVVGEIIWSRKCKKVFKDSPSFPSCDVFTLGSLFIIDCRFLQNINNSFDIICQLSSLTAMKEKICPSQHFLIFSSDYSFVSTLLTVLWGLRYYCISLITMLQAVIYGFNYL